MKITAGIAVEYRDLKISRWMPIEHIDDVDYFMGEGHEIKYSLYICAITDDDTPFRDRVLKSLEFKKTGTTNHNISFLHHTFQYREKSNEIIYINPIITI